MHRDTNKENLDIAHLRNQFNLGKLIKKTRQCLNCNDEFISLSKNNRLCTKCNDMINRMNAADVR